MLQASEQGHVQQHSSIAAFANSLLTKHRKGIVLIDHFWGQHTNQQSREIERTQVRICS